MFSLDYVQLGQCDLYIVCVTPPPPTNRKFSTLTFSDWGIGGLGQVLSCRCTTVQPGAISHPNPWCKKASDKQLVHVRVGRRIRGTASERMCTSARAVRWVGMLPWEGLQVNFDGGGRARLEARFRTSDVTSELPISCSLLRLERVLDVFGSLLWRRFMSVTSLGKFWSNEEHGRAENLTAVSRRACFSCIANCMEINKTSSVCD